MLSPYHRPKTMGAARLNADRRLRLNSDPGERAFCFVAAMCLPAPAAGGFRRDRLIFNAMPKELLVQNSAALFRG